MTQQTYNEMIKQLAKIKKCSRAVAACIIQAAIINFQDSLKPSNR